VNATQYFGLVNAMPIVPWQDVTGTQPFIVLSPHPDDESLGIGGLIALARRDHQDVSIVAVTDGAGSHPRSLTYPRERLIALRRAEMEEAGRILNVAPNHITQLGLPDSAAPKCGSAFDRAAATVSEIVTITSAASLFVTWRHDPHCDHEAAGVLADEVRRRHPKIRLWAYPVWGWHLSPKDEVTAPSPSGYRVDVTEVMAIKRDAIAAHASQMTDLIKDDPDGFRFNETTLAPFLSPYEYFIEISA
jgi:LmbE family N-acetylglucosaminyl deacetylase